MKYSRGGRLTGWREFLGRDIHGFEKLCVMLQHCFMYENHKCLAQRDFLNEKSEVTKGLETALENLCT